MSDQTLTGHCLCGAMTYRMTGEPLMTAVCHCEDCQRQSGSAFSVNVVVNREDFTMEGPSLGAFTTVGTDTGLERERSFCTTCGSPLTTQLAEAPQWTIVKAGTMDDRSALAPGVELWCESQQAWTAADDAERGQLPRGLPASV